MLNKEHFINRLHKILEYYHLSAATFADKINVQRSSISHILSGRNKPSLEFVLKIIDIYKEVSLEWLLYGKGNFPTLEKEVPKIKDGLFAQTTKKKETQETVNNEHKKTTNPSSIERIVVFYKNGTFKEYSETTM